MTEIVNVEYGDRPLRYKILIKESDCDIMGYAPYYSTTGAACFDLYCPESRTLNAKEAATLPLYIAFDVPRGWCLLVMPRSSSFSKHGLIVPPSIVDSDYKDGIHLQVHNLNNVRYTIRRKDRLCQAMLMPVYKPQLVEVDDLLATGRGGLGSTGR